MATTLGSPGVQVDVIDESFYTPAAPGTVPLIFVATSQDKANASQTGTAQGTTAANKDKVWLVTSQRDLTDTFGSPSFPQDSNGNSIHGSELNEYGLQAAYSLLGVSSRAYVARADVNLAELDANSSTPKGDPTSGTYWVDSDNTLFGLNEWDDTTGKFTVITPLIIDDDNVAEVTSGLIPVVDALGEVPGDYAVVVTSDNVHSVYYRTASSWEAVSDGFDGGKKVYVSPHTDYPNFTGELTGSIWVKTTTPGKGANWIVKYYSGSTQTWGTISSPVYTSTREALQKLDYTGGGKNIAVGSLFVEANYNHSSGPDANFKIWRRKAVSPTSAKVTDTTTINASAKTFKIRESLASSSSWSADVTITVPGHASTLSASKLPALLNASALVNVFATYNASTGLLTFSHRLGGDFQIKDTDGLLTSMNVNSADNVYASVDSGFDFHVTNWSELTFESKATAPYTLPADGTLWYNSNLSQADIMVHDGSTWVGYRLYDHGDGVGATDPLGPIVSATEPTTQQDGTTSLANGDIWISTASIDRYGKDIYVYNNSLKVWELQDVTDNYSPTGWVFADARWSDNGADDMEMVTSIEDLLNSDFLDPDAPDPALYPQGIKLWNTRRSGYNVKKYTTGHIDTTELNVRYLNDSMTNYAPDRWVTVSPNNEDGSGTFGRLAQRAYVVQKLKAFIDTNGSIRDTDTLNFNLIACPGYPEVIANMVGLNTERGQTAFVVGDTPMRLTPTATALKDWGTNAANAYDNGEAGAVTKDEYLGLFYPSGYATDNDGKRIVVPASHMMLRTIVNSDAKSYQWFAPAGTRRGGVDNATSVGYIDSEGEFKTVALHQGLRDVMQDPNTKVAINPIATLPGVGLVNFGQQTRAREASALDRINVVRLVAYLRRQLTILAKPFLFEPNDAQTRREIKGAAESLLLELVGQRALYDFIVVCDTTNNTPARIDRSELYMDIAIEPVKSVEFIYIPLRIKSTGEIAAGL